MGGLLLRGGTRHQAPGRGDPGVLNFQRLTVSFL